jgi:hypothetical protein
MSRSAQYHLHCFARNRAEAIPPYDTHDDTHGHTHNTTRAATHEGHSPDLFRGKTLSAAQQEELERLAREPLPNGGHLSAPAAAAIPAARPQVGHHAYTHLKGTLPTHRTHHHACLCVRLCACRVMTRAVVRACVRCGAEASLFSLETALAKGWQQLLRKERDSAAADADTVKAPQRD